MEDLIDQDVSISDMARQLDMSPFHFIRMFKKSAGLPPHKFLRARRLEKAKELLRLPHLSIAEVAERAGFGGVTQLERNFRRYVGTTPSSFRRQTIES
jgi:AraC family transcriptional regulator